MAYFKSCTLPSIQIAALGRPNGLMRNAKIIRMIPFCGEYVISTATPSRANTILITPSTRPEIYTSPTHSQMNTVSTRITGATAILSSSFRINNNALIWFPPPIVSAAFGRTVPPVFHRRPTENPIHTVTGIPVPCDPKTAAPAFQHFFLLVAVQVVPENFHYLFKGFHLSSTPLRQSLFYSYY